MQKLNLMGRLVKDAAVKTTQSGKNFVTFSVAVNSRLRNGEEKATFYDVLWSNYREKMIPWLKKGSVIYVTGDLDANLEVSNKDGQRYMRLNVYADSVQFPDLGGKNSTNTTTTATAQATTTPVMSTYTPQTAPIAEQVARPVATAAPAPTYQQPAAPVYQSPAPQPAYAPAPAPAYSQAQAASDDLPF